MRPFPFLSFSCWKWEIHTQPPPPHSTTQVKRNVVMKPNGLNIISIRFRCDSWRAAKLAGKWRQSSSWFQVDVRGLAYQAVAELDRYLSSWQDSPDFVRVWCLRRVSLYLRKRHESSNLKCRPAGSDNTWQRGLPTLISHSISSICHHAT